MAMIEPECPACNAPAAASDDEIWDSSEHAHTVRCASCATQLTARRKRCAGPTSEFHVWLERQ